MPAVLFGSISTLADTSEVQRAAFNDAFAQHGLDWTWSREDYIDMLATNGGQDRIAAYAEARGEDVDAAAVHQTKSELFREHLRAGGVEPRAGVAQTVRDARDAGFKIALVTTTSPENVAALGDALGAEVGVTDFDLLVDASMVEQPKPDPSAYTWALERLGESPGACVAVEDNVGGVRSANGAGVACVAFPNQNTAGQDFSTATATVERVDFTDLRGSALAG